MENSNSAWVSWPEALNLWEKQGDGEQAAGESCSLAHRVPKSQWTPPTETQTHLCLLLPERESLLLVQQPGNDHEAELASKLPVRERWGETEGVTFGEEGC